MLAEEKARRQGELTKHIYSLSKKLLETDAEKEAVASKLCKLYNKGFRHNYSDFFPIILDIARPDNAYSIDYLSENLEALRAFVENDYVMKNNRYTSLYPTLEKLCDHLNLEIGRWSYYSQSEHRIEDIASKTDSLNASMLSAQKSLETARDELTSASEQASSVQTDVIAVLSIFAGIAFVFSGGMSFLGSAVTAINDAKHYELVIMVIIVCGMVMFNTIFLMMYLVGKITRRNIYAACKTDNCTCEKQCRGIKKIRKRLPYVFYFNLLCILGIFIDGIIWYCDIRNWFFL